MACDEALTQRFRDALGNDPAIAEQRMMGGVCFMVNGNMIGGADRTKAGIRRFMFRTGKGNPQAEALPLGEPMVIGERLMAGFWFVDGDACDDALLGRWASLALAHANSLPPK
jgi:hypothetical protein